MRPVVVTFPDYSSLGQGVVRAPFLTAKQTVAQAQLALAQQTRLQPYLRRIGR